MDGVKERAADGDVQAEVSLCLDDVLWTGDERGAVGGVDAHVLVRAGVRLAGRHEALELPVLDGGVGVLLVVLGEAVEEKEPVALVNHRGELPLCGGSDFALGVGVSIAVKQLRQVGEGLALREACGVELRGQGVYREVGGGR